MIVVGVDHSEGAKEALRFAYEEARLRETPLRAVHAWQFGYIGAPGIESSVPVLGAELQRARAAAEAALDATVRETIPDVGEVTIERRVVEGAAAAVLVEESRDADLLVVGSARTRRVRPAAPGIGKPAVRPPRRVPGGDRAPEVGDAVDMDVRIKRAYEPAAASDGYRVLIDRIWPRGVTREEAHLDEWARELAPSTELRRWFGHDPARFGEFRRRYTEELAAQEEQAARAAPARTRGDADARLRGARHRAQRRGRARGGPAPRQASRDGGRAAGALRRRRGRGTISRSAAREELKIRVLDALGCALGALDAPPVRAIRAQLDDFGGRPLCTLIGGGRTAPDRAALYNGALVRYLDFNDSYFAPGETCHPSDNLAPVLAAAEYAGASGRELLTALAVAYQVQCRLSDEAPVRAKGFDHTTQGAYAAAAGAAKALAPRRAGDGERGRDRRHGAERAARDAHRRALAVEGARLPVHRLRRRRGGLSRRARHHRPARGVRGEQGLHGVDRRPLRDRLGSTKTSSASAAPSSSATTPRSTPSRRSRRCSSSAKRMRSTRAAVERIELETFQVAYDIIGGGEEGDKKEIAHEGAGRPLASLPARGRAARRPGACPSSSRPSGSSRPDVQALLRRVEVRPAADLTARFPAEHACRLRLHLAGGATLAAEKSDYEGFLTRPMGWERARQKFERLAAPTRSSPSSRPSWPRRSGRSTSSRRAT